MATLFVTVAIVTAGCGAGSGDTEVAPAPADPNAPATGTLKLFTYGDTVADEMIEPFEKANPDLNLEIATFDSNKAAAAKLAGGFEADVVEVCTDEMEPLLARGLLRPLDEKAVPAFHDLAFADAPEVRDDAGNAALEATPLTALGAAALALGLDDPMNLSDDQVEEAKQYLLDHRDNFRAFADSDASMVNLFKSGEVVIADGGRGTTQAMIDDGVPVEWIAPEEGAMSWVCGLAITSKAQNIDAAYKLINYYASPEAQAISGDMGFVAMNPKALPMVSSAFRKSADPRNLDNAIPQTEPDNADVYERAWQEVQAQ